MPPTARFCFVQISDPQFGMFGPPDGLERESTLFGAAIARINALKPAFVICTGDLVDQPGDDVQRRELQRLLAGLDPAIPLYAVPGNHDVGDRPDAASLAWYRTHFGPDRHVFTHGGRSFIGINSCLLADATAAPDEAADQRAWLVRTLEAAAGGPPPIVFLHHPPFLEDAEEDDGYFNLPRASRGPLLALLRRRGVETILAGHLHRGHDTDGTDPSVFVCGPVGMPLGDGCSGLRIVAAGLDGLRHRYFALDDIAGQEAFITSP